MAFSIIPIVHGLMALYQADSRLNSGDSRQRKKRSEAAFYLGLLSIPFIAWAAFNPAAWLIYVGYGLLASSYIAEAAKVMPELPDYSPKKALPRPDDIDEE